MTVPYTTFAAAQPIDFALSNDGSKIYLTTSGGNFVTLNAQTGAVISTQHIGNVLGAFDVSPDGTFALVIETQPLAVYSASPWWDSSADVQVYRIDLGTGVKTTFTYHATGDNYEFRDVAILTDGRAYLTENLLPGWSGFSDTVTLNPTTGAFGAGIGSYYHGALTTDADRDRLLIADLHLSAAEMHIYNPANNAFVDNGIYENGVYGYAAGIQAFSDAGNAVAIYTGGALHVYDAQFHYIANLTSTLGLTNVSGIAFNTLGTSMFVVDTVNSDIVEISTSNWTISHRIDLPPLSFGVSASAAELQLSPAGDYFLVMTSDGLIRVDNPYLSGSSTGTPGRDMLTGNASDNALVGLGGDDALYGLGGNDQLDGGDGDDRLDGGAGNDVMHGGAGNDEYYVDAGDTVVENANEGFDRVITALNNYTLPANFEQILYTGSGYFTGIGNAGDNDITGGALNDVLKGLDGNDYLKGQGGSDRLEGGLGNDWLDGGTGRDLLIGGAGDDIYQVDDSGDVIDEKAGEGYDDVIASSAAYTLSANVEDLDFIGASGSFAGTGNALDNYISTLSVNNSGADTLLGMGGNDWLLSGAGNDLLDGGTGDDDMRGGTGDDSYVVDSAGDIVRELAGEGTDTVRASISYTLGANVENLTLLGTAISGTGNELANVLTGNGSANILDGKAGADTMAGGGGDDTYYVDNAGDVIVEAANQGLDKLLASVSYTLKAGASVETMLTTNDAGLDAINLSGNELNNRIVGNAGANTLNGGAGDDRLEGLGGSDVLNGGTGTDLLIGGAGNDLYVLMDTSDTILEYAGGGADTVSLTLAAGGSYTLAAEVENMTVAGTNTAAHGNALGNTIANSGSGNSLWGEGGDDVLRGSDLAEIFHGGIGNDTIRAAGGADLIYGEAGNDLFVFATGNGADEIADFTHGSDRIDLSGLGIASFAQLQALMHQNGANTVIDFGGGNSVTLDGVTLGTLTASDFVFWH